MTSTQPPQPPPPPDDDDDDREEVENPMVEEETEVDPNAPEPGGHDHTQDDDTA